MAVGRVCPQPGRAGTKWREAYGVRGACSRCRMCGAVRKREQAPRTPYASRGLVGEETMAGGQTASRVGIERFIACLPTHLWSERKPAPMESRLSPLAQCLIIEQCQSQCVRIRVSDVEGARQSHLQVFV